ncbi:MAG TPA: AtzH-like domain-containing protein, partial [Gaiellaceae bacterium]
DAAFWSSELTVRYGVDECLYGAEAIAAWRRTAPLMPPGRTTASPTIATFGTDVACVSTEFRNDDSPTLGRQSQTWIRFPDGWRIVAAHVSLIPSRTET